MDAFTPAISPAISPVTTSRSRAGGPGGDVFGHFAAGWAARYGRPYPFAAAAGRNRSAVRALLTACGGSIGDATAALDRFLTDDAPTLHGHALSTLADRLAAYTAADR